MTDVVLSIDTYLSMSRILDYSNIQYNNNLI